METESCTIAKKMILLFLYARLCLNLRLATALNLGCWSRNEDTGHHIRVRMLFDTMGNMAKQK